MKDETMIISGSSGMSRAALAGRSAGRHHAVCFDKGLAVPGYESAAGDDRVVGPLAMSLATPAMYEVLMPIRLVIAGLSAWLLVAPLLLGYGALPAVSSVVAGTLLVLLATIRGSLTRSYGDGWPRRFTSKVR